MRLKLFLLVIFLASVVFIVYISFSKDTIEKIFTDTTRKLDYTEISKPSVGNIEHREALLISNTKYKYMSDLKDISSNLTTLKKTLENLGFTVKIKNNLNSENLEEAIEVFAKRLTKNRSTTGFLYYAGHGCQVERQGYLLPTNVDSTKRIKVKHNALKINEMIETLKASGNRVNMLFLDACRDIPTGTRGGVRGLAQAPKTPQGTLLVYATEAGETADDNTKFINSLINNIKQPNQNIRSIAFKISDEIATETKGNQIPEIFAKWVPKTILNQTTNIPKPKIETVETPTKVEKKKVVEISPPKVIEKKYSLTIKTNPIGATVKILNIKLRYKDRILLTEGNYKIEVSAQGYETKVTNLYIKSDISKNITLTKIIINEVPITQASYLGGREKDLQNSYYIKAGTYRDPNIPISRIIRNNFNYSLIKVGDDKTLSRVLIGPFFSRNQANAQLAKVRMNILSGAYVIKVK